MTKSKPNTEKVLDRSHFEQQVPALIEDDFSGDGVREFVDDRYESDDIPGLMREAARTCADRAEWLRIWPSLPEQLTQAVAQLAEFLPAHIVWLSSSHHAIHVVFRSRRASEDLELLLSAEANGKNTCTLVSIEHVSFQFIEETLERVTFLEAQSLHDGLRLRGIPDETDESFPVSTSKVDLTVNPLSYEVSRTHGHTRLPQSIDLAQVAQQVQSLAQHNDIHAIKRLLRLTLATLCND